MALSHDDLILALEGSFFIYPELPGVLTRLTVPGIQGHYTSVSHPEANMVGLARLGEENVDATIEQVKDIFRRENKIVGWYVGPTSTPDDLPGHLMSAGFEPYLEEAGLVLTNLETTLPVNAHVRVERASDEECMRAVPTISQAYGMPEEAAAYYASFLCALATQLDVSMYLAYLDGIDEPVAFASSIDLKDKPIMVLQGAATLPEHRGHGIYSTLVERRLQEARDRGIEAAVVQAVRSTSAPIAMKLGFQEICALELYAWDPARDRASDEYDRSQAESAR